MSSFICEKCGTEILDSPHGYLTGCEHYPTVKEVLTARPMRDCQVYTGKCRCLDGEPICVPK